MLAWTCAKVVVTVARASAVIPDHLHEYLGLNEHRGR